VPDIEDTAACEEGEGGKKVLPRVPPRVVAMLVLVGRLRQGTSQEELARHQSRNPSEGHNCCYVTIVILRR
jgi:hypothetical protein